MRSIKSNIRHWKVMAIASVLPLVFFFVACQDQVADDITEIAKNSTHALIVPDFIKQRFNELKETDPSKNFQVLELNQKATERMEGLRRIYGLPKSIEVFTAIDGKVVEQGIKGEAADVMLEESKGASGPQEKQTFAIIEFAPDVRRASETSAEEKIYTVVEEPPQFTGGYPAMMDFIKTNMRYPTDARTMGVEGTVLVSFIVWTDGTVSEVVVARGINESCDREAKRVVEMFPKWKPGKQSGSPVSVRFVLPIKFALG